MRQRALPIVNLEDSGLSLMKINSGRDAQSRPSEAGGYLDPRTSQVHSTVFLES